MILNSLWILFSHLCSPMSKHLFGIITRKLKQNLTAEQTKVNI